MFFEIPNVGDWILGTGDWLIGYWRLVIGGELLEEMKAFNSF